MKKILGIDLGVASIGWSLIGQKEDENSGDAQILKSGVRIFQSNEQRADAAPGESAKSDRGTQRSVRRQRDRRARRKQKLYHLLYKNRLAPKRELWGEWIRLDPYLLRAKALDKELTLTELGRALYHLNQRRGYKSNRKTGEEKGGEVSQGILKVETLMKQYEARTLGEYGFKISENHFEANKKPLDDDWRIRNNYTQRDMFVDEFKLIWKAQQKFHPQELSRELKKQVSNTIFHQRKLKSQAHLIGKCPLEKNKKRIPKAHLLFQEFRIRKNLNNLALADENGLPISLSLDDKNALYERINKMDKITFKALKTFLIKRGTIANSNVNFNLEEDGKTLKGNTTNKKLAHKKAFGKEWYTLDRTLQDYIVYVLIHFDDPKKIKAKAMSEWDRTEEQATYLGDLVLEKKYGNFSEKAIKKLLPFLKQGMEESKAIKNAGYELFNQEPGTDTKLPKPPYMTNSVVYHALIELRKVMNAIIREYGMPDTIRVELTRDIKASYDHRQKMTKEMKKLEKRNQDARKELKNPPFNRQEPTSKDILWYNLWQECEKICPYTGKSIPAAAFNSGEFQVEHIIPLSRSLDDSYANKILCEADFNRKKGKRIPWECVPGLISEDDLLQRKRRLPKNKQRKFVQTKTESNSFINRQLSDTRYISREASSYLKQLACTVEVVKGQSTALLRDVWGLNGVLNTKNEEVKTREDHRHHAVDAIVVAFTSISILKRLSDEYKKLGAEECKNSEETGKENYKELKRRMGGRLRLSWPWRGFRNDVERSINDITVSHRVNRKISGALHEETFYGPTKEPVPKKNKAMMVVRKPVHKLSEKDLTLIRDGGIKAIVNAEIQERMDAGETLKNAIKSLENDPPYISSPKAKVPIRKVRLLMEKTPAIMHSFEDENGEIFKHALYGSNHHIAIYETLDKKGGRKQVGFVVTTAEAARRVKDGEPIVDVNYRSNDHTFLFSLSINDMIINHEDEEIYRVQKIESNGNITFRKNNISLKGPSDPGAYRKSANKLKAKKIKISPIGEVFPASD